MEAKLTNRLIGFGNMNYTYGQNTSGNEPMRRIPPFNGKLGLRANLSKNILLIGEWVFAAKQNRLSSGDIADDRIAPSGTPGWNVINIYGTFTHEIFTLSASLQNLFNEKYRTHGSGIDGIGRSFWVSLKININQ
jgi:outer membrane receptor protein involved in Fe transport